MTREEYEERQERKVERLQSKARNARQRSDDAYNRSHEMGKAIPFGQPILVGHHSEGWDRRYRQKIRDLTGKSVEEGKKAAYYEARARAVDENLAISSDDPDAVEKLNERIAEREQMQAIWKAINKIVKSRRKHYSQEQRVLDLQHLEVDGQEVLLSKETAQAFFVPDCCGRVGIAAYQLQNNNANICRMKKRVKALEAQKAEVDQEKEYETSEGAVKIFYNTYENRVQLLFPGKPSDATRTLLKRNGFRWSNRFGAWQRHLNNSGKYEAKSVIKKIMVDPDDMDMTTYIL